MKLDMWRKKIGPRKKKKLDSCGGERLVWPLGLNTANLHTSIFDKLKKDDTHYIIIIGAAVVSGLGVSKTALWGGLSSKV